MSLNGRLVSSLEVKSNGDVFHEIFAYKPHHLASSFPDAVQRMVLLKGSWGTVGSVVLANYTLEGKKNVAKAIVEAIDSYNKSVTYKVIEGDLMQLYRTMSITVHVDTRGGKNLVTWIMEYVKLAPSVPDPNSLMDFAFAMTKGIESHHTPTMA